MNHKKVLLIILATTFAMGIACVFLDKYFPSKNPISSEHITRVVDQAEAYRGYLAYKLKL